MAGEASGMHAPLQVSCDPLGWGDNSTENQWCMQFGFFARKFEFYTGPDHYSEVHENQWRCANLYPGRV